MCNSQEVDLIISSRWVLPIAPRNIALDNHSIAIDQGNIVALAETASLLTKFHSKQHIRLNDHVLMPGLVNAHNHTPMTLFRGLADDLALMDWLTHHIWPAEKALINPESVAIGSRLAIAEMLGSGTTCFNDNYFFPDITAKVVMEEGIRARLGCVIMNVATEWASDEAGYFARAEETLENPLDSDRISWTMCPHAPYTVSDSNLKKVKEFSQHYGIPIHMHLHETAFEIHQSLKDYGKRPLQRVEELGLLSDQFIAVHMTELTEDEIKRLQHTGSHVVHCPKSNLKLASGFAPIAKLLEAQVNVAIGTDGAASNNQLDMFSELNTAALLAKAVSQNPQSLSASQALAAATLNGAKALGLDHLIGSLEPGKAADIIAINLAGISSQPIYHPMSHLVYATDRSQVSDVWVNGDQLLKSGHFTRLDTQCLRQSVQQWAEKAKDFKN